MFIKAFLLKDFSSTSAENIAMLWWYSVNCRISQCLLFWCMKLSLCENRYLLYGRDCRQYMFRGSSLLLVKIYFPLFLGMTRRDFEIDTKEKNVKQGIKLNHWHTSITEILAVIWVSTGPKQWESYPRKLCMNRKFSPKLHVTICHQNSRHNWFMVKSSF